MEAWYWDGDGMKDRYSKGHDRLFVEIILPSDDLTFCHTIDLSHDYLPSREIIKPLLYCTRIRVASGYAFMAVVLNRS